MKRKSEPNAPPATDVPRLAEHLFRHESGRLVSILTGIFGSDRLQLAEDVVQEALVRALQVWPYYGVPENPSAWIMQTARNLALDVLRREKRFHDKQPDITAAFERWPASHNGGSPLLAAELRDDQLRLMFTCCHPEIPEESQAALALKTLCGFNPAEIASAFLTTETAILKRLTRARQKIRDQNIPFEIPAGQQLTPRLNGVLQIITLLFNEGYKASSGNALIRAELCTEAIRLARVLAEHPVASQPKTHALMAMMLLHSSRFSSRTDEHGNIIRLKDQDRSVWDREMIGRGMMHLAKAASGDEVSEYHIQAGISACHCAAADYKSTDWPRILEFYDQWTNLDSSPVIALNRAVAVANVNGPAAGIKAVEAIPNRERLNPYYLVYAVLGELESQLDHPKQAATQFRKAMELSGTTSEKQFLSARMEECETGV